MAKILCVDDEPHVVTLKCKILEAAGHTVTASTSARDAMEKILSNTYDAVVTDWRLGDANGRAVVQAACPWLWFQVMLRKRSRQPNRWPTSILRSPSTRKNW